MLSFQDATASVEEQKNARMEQRAKPHVKAAIQEAAALLGVDESTFVTSVAYERAKQTISDHRGTILSREDAVIFLAALYTPAAPTSELKAAAAALKARVRHDG